MDSSKILPYVVATLLGGAASLVVGTAVSQSWCNISGCTVYPPILTNPGGGGGGGGGWGGSSTDPNTVHCSWYSGWFTCTGYPLPPQVCVDLYETLPANCDLTRPPPLTVMAAVPRAQTLCQIIWLQRRPFRQKLYNMGTYSRQLATYMTSVMGLSGLKKTAAITILRKI